MSNSKLTHVDTTGKAKMVDVGDKTDSARTAVASARVLVSPELMELLKNNALAKGDALAVARIAGIQAAKRTDQLIPLCHPLPISHLAIEIALSDAPTAVDIRAEAKTTYKTGVEMEALTAASVAALTIYDMGKAIDKGMVIEHIRLESKDGGKSGPWRREKK